MTDWLQPNPFSPNSDWTRAYIDRLPDSAFLLVDRAAATHVDAQGRSHPLSVRALPVKNHVGNYSCAHLRNAAARANQVQGFSERQKMAAKRKAERLYRQHCKE